VSATSSASLEPPPTSSARRVAIVTLGCGRNEVDSDQLAGLFHRQGAEVVEDADDAEVVLVNTCTFIAPAKQESIDTVLAACQLKDEGDARAVVVVGCMAQRYPDELADAIPEADAVVGFEGYNTLPQLVDDILAGRGHERVTGIAPPADPTARPSLPLLISPPSETPSDPSVTTGRDRAADTGGADTADDGLLAVHGTRGLALDLDVTELPPTTPRADEPILTGQDALDRIPATGPRFPLRRFGAGPGPAPAWAYLKIASGCDRACTFCAIPSFRGRFRSRPTDELVAEGSWLVEQGARELVLVSENTTSWGKDLPCGRDGQAAMLRELAAIDGLERLRLMYLQPAELTTSLLEAIATEPKVASYFDLSLQHVSGPVVRRMARSGDAERFAKLIGRIRELDPDAVFRSNFILGFPGETEQDVEVLEQFLVEQRLDWVGLFTFSAEDGTPSHDMPDQVPAEVAEERRARVSELQESLADEAARRFVGRRLEVTVDEHLEVDGAGAVTVARSYREAPETDGEVQLVTPDGAAADLPVGRTVTATVTDALGVDLVAVPDGPRG
jgi:ribosomal protein S12 methylthiotransferase